MTRDRKPKLAQRNFQVSKKSGKLAKLFIPTNTILHALRPKILAVTSSFAIILFLLGFTLPSSAATVPPADTSSVTLKPLLTPAQVPQQFVVAADVSLPTVQVDTVSATSESEWKAWHTAKLKAAAAKKARAAAKAAAKKAAKAAAKAAAVQQQAFTAAANTSVGVEQAYAFSIMASAHGWSGTDQQACLVNLWNRESGWSATASNASSGAYGIPQALPGSKMGTIASDWKTNYKTQIKWGLNYIAGSYGSPCSAWDHSNSVGWY